MVEKTSTSMMLPPGPFGPPAHSIHYSRNQSVSVNIHINPFWGIVDGFLHESPGRQRGIHGRIAGKRTHHCRPWLQPMEGASCVDRNSLMHRLCVCLEHL